MTKEQSIWEKAARELVALQSMISEGDKDRAEWEAEAQSEELALAGQHSEEELINLAEAYN